MMSKPRLRQSPVQQVVGWREQISLPDFGIFDMPAKIDTGARTSALHAVDQTVVERDGVHWVEFSIPLKNHKTVQHLSAPVVEERDIKNTGGVPERRLVVRTTLNIGKRQWMIEVSLANREQMEFDLIIGRSAIRTHNLLVDPGRSYIASRRSRKLEKTIMHRNMVSEMRKGEEE